MAKIKAKTKEIKNKDNDNKVLVPKNIDVSNLMLKMNNVSEQMTALENSLDVIQDVFSSWTHRIMEISSSDETDVEGSSDPEAQMLVDKPSQ